MPAYGQLSIETLWRLTCKASSNKERLFDEGWTERSAISSCEAHIDGISDCGTVKGGLLPGVVLFGAHCEDLTKHECYITLESMAHT